MTPGAVLCSAWLGVRLFIYNGCTSLRRSKAAACPKAFESFGNCVRLGNLSVLRKSGCSAVNVECTGSKRVVLLDGIGRNRTDNDGVNKRAGWSLLQVVLDGGIRCLDVKRDRLCVSRGGGRPILSHYANQ